MDRIDYFAALLSQRQIPNQVLLMPADLYATEINNLPSQLTDQYFEQVDKEGQRRKYKVRPWSVIKANNIEIYNSLNKPQIISTLPNGIVDRAIEASQRRSGFNNPYDQEQAAYNYLRERLCEANIIEEIYQPLKVSMGRKDKDNFIDGSLPRVYILPETIMFPWLK